MSTTTKRHFEQDEATPTAEACRSIMEFLLYKVDTRYVTIERIQEGTNLRGSLLGRSIRYLATSVGAIRYSARGEYEIIDLERYFDCPAPGSDKRYHSPQL